MVQLDSPYIVSYLCWIQSDLSRSFNVKANGSVGLSWYEFLLVSNCNHMSTSHRLAVIHIWKQNPESEGMLPLRWSWLVGYFGDISLTHTHTDQSRWMSGEPCKMGIYYAFRSFWPILVYIKKSKMMPLQQAWAILYIRNIQNGSYCYYHYVINSSHSWDVRHCK